MGQKITIKPNDNSWVEEKIKRSFWPLKTYLVLKWVSTDRLGGPMFFSDSIGGDSCVWTIDGNWELYEEPEEKCEHGFSKEFCCYGCLKIKHDNSVNSHLQGHHCSGKCTKLGDKDFSVEKDGTTYNFKINSEKKDCPHIDQTRYPINRDDIVECSECGILKPKEKECEHDWESYFVVSGKDEVKCQKCGKRISGSEWIALQFPFWLKVGDVIRAKDNLCNDRANCKVIKITNSIIHLEVLGNSSYSPWAVEKNKITSEEYKKIKLVSPAMVYEEGPQRWRISHGCYSNYDDAENDCMTPEGKIIWPAKDQFGREIFYEVDG